LPIGVQHARVLAGKEAIMWTRAISLLVIVIVSLGFCTLAADEIYPVEILVSTISDWTDVILSGGTLIVHSYEILEGRNAPGLTVHALSAVAVGKQGYDATQIVIRFQAYLTELTLSWMRITINKGHIGETTVSLRTVESAGSDLLASYTHKGVADASDPANARTYSLRTTEITSRVAPQILEVPVETSLGGQKVLAFYYSWYGIPEGPSGRWVHWNPYKSHRDSAHIPLVGYYDSQDPETVRRHIHEAKEAGIDGFIATWWGKGTFEDRAFQVLLDVASEESFLVTVYYEDANSPAQIISDVNYIISRYSSNSSFLTVEGLPVIFFYVRVTEKFSLAEWENVFAELDRQGRRIFAIADGLRNEFLSVFQGIHTYNPVSLPLDLVAEQYKAASLLARLQGALFAATVVPGYDEAYKKASNLFVDRAGGGTYRAYWDIAHASNPQWILITSFNEWHEGSEIEPSVEFGTTYLILTAEEAAAWRSGASTDTSPADRDGDGVPDSEDYCPDFPGMKETNGC